MLDEIKEDVERLEKQFDGQSLIKVLRSFPDELKDLLKIIPAASMISIVKNRRSPVIILGEKNDYLMRVLYIVLKLCWRKELPDEQGWWCLENNCVKVYQVVVDTCSKDIKIYGVD